LAFGDREELKASDFNFRSLAYQGENPCFLGYRGPFPIKLVQTMGEKMGYFGNTGLFHGSQDG
jgi:hypothetical protein